MALQRDARGVSLLARNIQSYITKSQSGSLDTPFRRNFLGFSASRPAGHPRSILRPPAAASPATGSPDPQPRQGCEEASYHHKQQQQSQLRAWQHEQQAGVPLTPATLAAALKPLHDELRELSTAVVGSGYCLKEKMCVVVACCTIWGVGRGGAGAAGGAAEDIQYRCTCMGM